MCFHPIIIIFYNREKKGKNTADVCSSLNDRIKPERYAQLVFVVKNGFHYLHVET